jgi:fatty-acyl-CoA synthase
MTSNDRLWLVVPLFYGFAAVNAIAAAWTHGAALIVQEAFEAHSALEIMERERASVYYGLGNMTRSLIAAQAEHRRDIRSLTKGLSGYSREDKRLAIEVLGVSGLCSIYGLTESHGLAAMTAATDPAEVRLSTDGRALPGWEFRVVEPDTETPVPGGEVGHLLIRGPLTSGYLGDPELTAACFTDDGFFRTGDLVRISADGSLHFHSRLKELIKVGGINVSPREVEALLQRHPGVSQAHVVGVPDPVRGEVVAAVVERRPGHPVSEDDLRAFAREHAAAFKTPAHVLFRTESQLPRLASGKVALQQLKRDLVEELGAHGSS